MRTPKPKTSSGKVTAEHIKEHANQLKDALDIYNRFIQEDLHEQDELPSEIEGYLRELDEESFESEIPPEMLLATEIKEMYFESKDLQLQYELKQGKTGAKDVSQVAEDLKPARRATFKVEKAGYEIDYETEEINYQVPKEICLAKLITEDERPRNPPNPKLHE